MPWRCGWLFGDPAFQHSSVWRVELCIVQRTWGLQVDRDFLLRWEVPRLCIWIYMMCFVFLPGWLVAFLKPTSLWMLPGSTEILMRSKMLDFVVSLCANLYSHIYTVIYIIYYHPSFLCSLGVRSWLKWIPSTSTPRFLRVNTRNWKLLEAFWRGCLDYLGRSNSLGMGIMKYHEEVAVPKLSSWIRNWCFNHRCRSLVIFSAI